MHDSYSSKYDDGLLLLARILMMALFVLFGWSKLTDFSGTAAYMASQGLPLPTLVAAVVVLMEFFVGLALVLGFYTRPLALLLALYTLGTALIGHHFWTMAGADRMANAINFYKNLAIMGGLLLLYVTGPGKYSLDRR
ncbi:DoxX family protein [Frateuria terrea]|uniref:Putative oxidoreductase n=1 Tax=Frateuria terrea TaxID=529704 RepID=A0A1H6TTH2_9GAMM|nr:DoxX family protein [Frateuria terrea]SEI80537.1 putative oxidoreductase [Frateuria terrea]SFP41798.1 putative oxidoreductase [Frateuria terrea]